MTQLQKINNLSQEGKIKSYFVLSLRITIYALLCLIGCSPSKIDVSGDIFIVTRGGGSVKLGLVEVRIFSENIIQPFIQSKIQLVKAAVNRSKINIEAWEKAGGQEILDSLEKDKEAKWNQYGAHIFSKTYQKQYEISRRKWAIKSIEYDSLVGLGGLFEAEYFNYDLPKPLLSSKTDADGKFTVKLKPGKYAIVAAASRMVGEKTEKYDWLIWINLDSKQPNKIFLSNDNLFENDCAENLVNLRELKK